MGNKLLGLSLLFNLIFVFFFLYLVYALGGFSYVWFKINNRGVAGVYESTKNVFEIMPKQDSAVVFLGNSLTAGCDWSELLGRPIINRGIPGEVTQGILDRLASITGLQPAQIFLMIGINDLIFLPPLEILKNYQSILSRIQSESPHSQVFILSVLPVNNAVKQAGIRNADILELNQGLRKLATEFHFSYIDLHSQLTDETGRLNARYTFDGIHINGAAYLIWKNAVSPFLRKAVE